jgi:hypothetical protein
MPATITGGGDGDDGPQIGDVITPDDEQPILKRRIDLLRGEQQESTLPDSYEFSFNPNSMVGSWFHRLENDEMVWQGVILGEPAHRTYLVQIERLAPGAENVQRLVTLDQMTSDEDGYDWRFYDSEHDCRAAFALWVASERERL